MTQVPLRFVSAGFGHSICANLVLAVLTPEPAPIRRFLKDAKAGKLYIDMTSGHAVKSLLLIENGKVAGCAISPKTMRQRLNADTTADTGDEEGQDDVPLC